MSAPENGKLCVESKYWCSSGVIKNESETFIFPNPTDDFLFIQSNTRKDISMVELFDAMGRLVYTEVVYNSEIDLSNFPTGIYTLSYKHGQAKITKKVIKI